MKRLIMLIAVLVAVEAVFSQTLDPRFRTFGPVPEPINGKVYPYRNGGAGIGYRSDYIVVGILDGADVGPYAGLEAGEVFAQWAFLRRQKRPDYDWYDPGDWGDGMGQALYEACLGVLGVRSGLQYQKDVLLAQIAAEKGRIAGYVNTALSDNPNRTELVFEIGNEPNAFPAMAPDVYAWYFLKWRKTILEEFATINAARTAKSLPALKAKFMPAGLWIFEGMPDFMTRFLGHGIDIYVDPVGFNLTELHSAMYPDTRKYMEDFFTALQTPLLGFCNTVSSGSNHIQCGDYEFDNLKITEWNKITVAVQGVSFSYSTVKSFQVLKPLTELIEVGNLHFYPYIARQAAMTLDQQLAFLKELSVLYASKAGSGEVWLTEVSNVNPYGDAKAASSVVTPVLKHLKDNKIPAITRWYWFEAIGDDSKWSMLPEDDDGGAFLLQYFLGKTAMVFLDLIGISIRTGLSGEDETNLLRLMYDYQDQAPVQGLLNGDKSLREIGKAFYNLSITGANPTSPTVGNLSVTISNYKPGNVNNAPWQPRAYLNWDLKNDPDGDFAFHQVWYGRNSPPIFNSPAVDFEPGVCTGGGATGYDKRCTVQIPNFAFGDGYVQLAVGDGKTQNFTNPVSISNPYPSEPANTYCPENTDYPLGISSSPGVFGADLLKFVDTKSMNLTMTNIVDPANPTTHYTTKASGSGFYLQGGRGTIVSSSNLDMHTKLVKSYPDGHCIAITCNGPADFVVTSIPSGLTKDNFVMANPMEYGTFTFTVKNPARPQGTPTDYRTEKPDVLQQSSLAPKRGIVWLKDVLRYPGDEITEVRWRPGEQTWYCPSSPVRPFFFRSISFSRINPYWPEFTGFESTPLTYDQSGTMLPLFKVPYGSTVRIKTGIKPSLDAYAVTLDGTSAGKGIGFSKSESILYWTPGSQHVGVHVVQLTLSPENASTIPKKVAIQVVAPAITSTDKPVYAHGQTVVVTGTNLGTAQSAAKVTVGNYAAVVTGSSETKVTAQVPAGVEVGPATIKVQNGSAISNAYTITVRPSIASVSGDFLAGSGRIMQGKQYTLFGNGFGNLASGITVRVGSKTATVLSAAGSSLVFRVPAGLNGAQNIVVQRSGTDSEPYPVRVYSGIMQILSQLLN